MRRNRCWHLRASIFILSKICMTNTEIFHFRKIVLLVAYKLVMQSTWCPRVIHSYSNNETLINIELSLLWHFEINMEHLLGSPHKASFIERLFSYWRGLFTAHQTDDTFYRILIHPHSYRVAPRSSSHYISIYIRERATG